MPHGMLPGLQQYADTSTDKHECRQANQLKQGIAIARNEAQEKWPRLETERSLQRYCLSQHITELSISLAQQAHPGA